MSLWTAQSCFLIGSIRSFKTGSEPYPRCLFRPSELFCRAEQPGVFASAFQQCWGWADELCWLLWLGSGTGMSGHGAEPWDLGDSIEASGPGSRSWWKTSPGNSRKGDKGVHWMKKKWVCCSSLGFSGRWIWYWRMELIWSVYPTCWGSCSMEAAELFQLPFFLCYEKIIQCLLLSQHWTNKQTKHLND